MQLWSVARGKLVESIPCATPVVRVASLPDDPFILLAEEGGGLQVAALINAQGEPALAASEPHSIALQPYQSESAFAAPSSSSAHHQHDTGRVVAKKGPGTCQEAFQRPSMLHDAAQYGILHRPHGWLQSCNRRLTVPSSSLTTEKLMQLCLWLHLLMCMRKSMTGAPDRCVGSSTSSCLRAGHCPSNPTWCTGTELSLLMRLISIQCMKLQAPAGFPPSVMAPHNCAW